MEFHLMTISVSMEAIPLTMKTMSKCSPGILRPTAKKGWENSTAETKPLQDIANGLNDDDATSEKIKQELADTPVKR